MSSGYQLATILGALGLCACGGATTTLPPASPADLDASTPPTPVGRELDPSSAALLEAALDLNELFTRRDDMMDMDHMDDMDSDEGDRGEAEENINALARVLRTLADVDEQSLPAERREVFAQIRASASEELDAAAAALDGPEAAYFEVADDVLAVLNDLQLNLNDLIMELAPSHRCLYTRYVAFEEALAASTDAHLQLEDAEDMAQEDAMYHAQELEDLQNFVAEIVADLRSCIADPGCHDLRDFAQDVQGEERLTDFFEAGAVSNLRAAASALAGSGAPPRGAAEMSAANRYLTALESMHGASTNVDSPPSPEVDALADLPDALGGLASSWRESSSAGISSWLELEDIRHDVMESMRESSAAAAAACQ